MVKAKKCTRLECIFAIFSKKSRVQKQKSLRKKEKVFPKKSRQKGKIG
jgi:hypothetical protein